ncbi:hypothetical protein GQ674_17245 [Stenotrophomonas sp. 364]|nr:hypothetical protein GQ674_17245 [Stenotrophomonas sp. 364]
MLVENWVAVSVFRRCKAAWLTGMHPPIYGGVAAQEIEAAARLERVPVADYPDLLDALDVLISTTRSAHCTTLN